MYAKTLNYNETVLRAMTTNHNETALRAMAFNHNETALRAMSFCSSHGPHPDWPRPRSASDRVPVDSRRTFSSPSHSRATGGEGASLCFCEDPHAGRAHPPGEELRERNPSDLGKSTSADSHRCAPRASVESLGWLS